MTALLTGAFWVKVLAEFAARFHRGKGDKITADYIQKVKHEEDIRNGVDSGKSGRGMQEPRT